MGEGKESFGFTPGGGVDQNAAERRTAASIRREQPNPQSAPYPETYGHGAERPRWLLLLVGVLLGTGGTLLTSAFWLPDNTNLRLAHHVEGHSNEAERNAPPVADLELRGQPAADHLDTPQLKVTEPALPNDADLNPLPGRLNQAYLVSDEQPSELFSNRFDESAGLYRVQLAAVDSESAAWTYWSEINERLPGIFTDVEPVFNERVIDKRLYLRIWVGAFTDQTDAISYCDWLKEQGQDCFVFRADKV